MWLSQIFLLFHEAAMLLFYTAQRISVTKVVLFSKICYHISLQGPILSSANVAPASLYVHHVGITNCRKSRSTVLG
jgi:hypothetical protein